jgi:hypothetical protein
MPQNRRKFLGTAAMNAAALAVLPGTLRASLPSDLSPVASADDWDYSWIDRLKGKRSALFDNTEPESGYGVWRAAIWASQYADLKKMPASDIVPVIVLRHNAIVLAMKQQFWDKYTIGAKKQVTHPLTGERTDKNPALLDERDGIPVPWNTRGLRKQLDRNVPVLACNLALQDCVDLIANVEKLSDADARKVALAYLVPGIILQPSGVLAVTLAQEAGANYVKAS